MKHCLLYIEINPKFNLAPSKRPFSFYLCLSPAPSTGVKTIANEEKKSFIVFLRLLNLKKNKQHKNDTIDAVPLQTVLLLLK